MSWSPGSVVRRWFDPECGAADRLIPRWIFLRAPGTDLLLRILLAASSRFAASSARKEFFLPAIIWTRWPASLARRASGLLQRLLWLSSSAPHADGDLLGRASSLPCCWWLNVWPRAMLFVCFVCFLSFVAAAEDFSGYQSDGMLLEAGFIALFFAPAGFWPGLGRGEPAVARQPLPAAVGMVSHLLRIRCGEAG